jgi:predicted MFS family arabinose efflux permease
MVPVPTTAVRLRSSIGIDHLLFLLAVSVGSALSHAGTNTMPFQIGALMDGSHRTTTEAGLFGFLQIGALSLGMALIAPVVGRIRPQAIAIAGCGLVAAANIALYFSNNRFVQLALAVFTGLGYGIIFAATVSAAASSRDPDRVYSIGNGGALLLIVGLMSVVPIVSSRLGIFGVFATLSILALVCLPLFFRLESGKRLETPKLAAWRTPGAPGLLFAWTAASTGTGALYAFSERLGHNIHLPAAQIGAVLSSGAFVGLIGTGFAALLGKGIDRPVALNVGMCGAGTACLVLGFAVNLPMFVAGVFAYWIFYMFLYSYLLGTAALLDPAGRVGILAGALERLGYAVGAGIGGLVAEHQGYAAIGVMGSVSCGLAIGVGFPTLFRELRLRKVAARS